MGFLYIFWTVLFKGQVRNKMSHFYADFQWLCEMSIWLSSLDSSMSVDHQCRKSIGFGLFFLSVYLSSWKFDMFWSGLFITVSIEDTYFYTKTALCVLDYSMHSKSSLKTLKTSSCRIHKASKDSKKKIFLVDSAKKRHGLS